MIFENASLIWNSFNYTENEYNEFVKNLDWNNEKAILRLSVSGDYTLFINGRYAGRKPIELDDQLLKQVAIAFLNNRISEQEAMQRLGINSRSTFYRRIRSFR